MKIALCSIGSRGDVQPFLILAEFLGREGHEVRISSAKMYESLAAKYEVNYFPFEGDYASIMDDKALKKKIGRNPFALSKALKEQVYPIIENSLETFYDLLTWSDVMLYHPKTMMDGIAAAQKHKLIKAYVVPLFTATKKFSNPIISFLPLPSFLNKLSYKFVYLLMNSLSKPVKNFRAKHALPKSKGLLDTPVLYGISPSFITKPQDYPSDHLYTGFWLNEHKEQSLPTAVTDFMSAQGPTLIITFGSMPYQSKIDINDFVQAILGEHKLKILIVRGWGLREVKIKDGPKVMSIESAPFELLFPLANYIIHHGGAGTTATALKAGLPQMICPVLHPFGDQYFWGKQIEKKKIGPKPIPLKKLSIQNMLDGLAVLCQKEIEQNAKDLKNKLAEENGLAMVKNFIENHY